MNGVLSGAQRGRIRAHSRSESDSACPGSTGGIGGTTGLRSRSVSKQTARSTAVNPRELFNLLQSDHSREPPREGKKHKFWHLTLDYEKKPKDIHGYWHWENSFAACTQPCGCRLRSREGFRFDDEGALWRAQGGIAGPHAGMVDRLFSKGALREKPEGRIDSASIHQNRRFGQGSTKTGFVTGSTFPLEVCAEWKQQVKTKLPQKILQSSVDRLSNSGNFIPYFNEKKRGPARRGGSSRLLCRTRSRQGILELPDSLGGVRRDGHFWEPGKPKEKGWKSCYKFVPQKT